MSIPVEVSALADTLSRFPFAYLLTAGDEGAPHAVAVTPALVDGALVVEGLGRRSLANARLRSAVALVWPPADAGDYSLIVDGHADVDEAGASVRIEPVRAVLHRPAAGVGRPAGDGRGESAAAGRCGADCVERPTDPGEAPR